jgi:methylated-DNA-[protein]-cysteine S-methyltransferase
MDAGCFPEKACEMRQGKIVVEEEVFFSLYDSGEGTGSVVATGSGLLEVALPIQINREQLLASLRDRYPGAQGGSPLTEKAAGLLERYFSGEPVAFELPMDLRGCTGFQQLVYHKVREIPYGSTKSYGGIARMVDRPGAARGVGAAMARNPLPIVIPCHRVIGVTGKMTGYSAPGGVERKRVLLEMEGVVLNDK